MSPKADLYTRITDKIVADLERGNLTWMQPWQAGHAAGPVSRPLRANGMAYQGINVLLLWAASMEKGYSAPIWMTYHQAQELGGQVRKDEHSIHVVYANAYTKTELNGQGDEIEKRIPFLKNYPVFNVEQIDGLPGHFYALAHPQANDNERIAAAEAFFASTGATIRHGGNSAYYDSGQDLVQMPPLAAFRDSEAYYGTLAHEIVHWTKHPTRLDRNLGRKRFGDAGYAFEELVAKVGRAFLCAALAITPLPRGNRRLHPVVAVGAQTRQAGHLHRCRARQKALDFLYRTVEKAEGRLSTLYERTTEHEPAQESTPPQQPATAPLISASQNLFQRGENRADAILREAYGPIPEARESQHGTGGSAIPETIHGWQWSGTFGRWSALVTFPDGWHGFTYPLSLHRCQ